jgi:pilus assembly protein CpaC
MNLGRRCTAIVAFLTLSALGAAQTPVPAVQAGAQSSMVAAAQTPAPQTPSPQAPNAPAPSPQARAPQATAEGDQESPNELSVTVGKSLIVSTTQTIERISVGYGDVAEATAVGPREVLVNGKAPGQTSLIVWQQGGNKLFFDLLVRPNHFVAGERVDAVRREIRKELPGDKINLSFENDTVFLRGSVKDLTSADRAAAIAGTLGKTVNLLYVSVPPPEAQILLKVRFASVDRSVSQELGLNLISTGATNTIGRITTGQFSPPPVTTPAGGPATISLSDALNIFLLRPDLNLAATIRAFEGRGLVEILAEPNVLAFNGRQASFLAGGEFPYPTIQGGVSGGVPAVTIAFREFGVRINVIPTISPRGTIRLEVAPEVSALDFSGGISFQGFTIPALTVRRVHTDIELAAGQSFAIGGLLDNRLTETVDKVPGLGDIPILGRLFKSRSLRRDNTELLVLITPELVRPLPAGQPLPGLNYPGSFLPANSKTLPRTPGMEITGAVPVTPSEETVPVEQLIQSMKRPKLDTSPGASGLPDGTQQQQLWAPTLLAPVQAAPPEAAPPPAASAAPPAK